MNLYLVEICAFDLFAENEYIAHYLIGGENAADVMSKVEEAYSGDGISLSWCKINMPFDDGDWFELTESQYNDLGGFSNCSAC